MILFVGLGNPGQKYKRNRHNIGFMAIEALARYFKASAPRSNFKGLTQEASLDIDQKQEKILMLKPETFMNLSGQSVQALSSFYKIPPQQIFVFHDELDLSPGKVRIKTGGGAAGHNGLRSIMNCIGADFNRIRLGIGHPGHKELVTPYVLSNFSKEEQVWVEKVCQTCAKNLHFLVTGENHQFQNHLAQEIFL